MNFLGDGTVCGHTLVSGLREHSLVLLYTKCAVSETGRWRTRVTIPRGVPIYGCAFSGVAVALAVAFGVGAPCTGAGKGLAVGVGCLAAYREAVG